MLARILHPRENHPRFPEVRLRGTHVIDLKKLGIDSDDQLIVSLPFPQDRPARTECERHLQMERDWLKKKHEQRGILPGGKTFADR